MKPGVTWRNRRLVDSPQDKTRHTSHGDIQWRHKHRPLRAPSFTACLPLACKRVGARWQFTGEQDRDTCIGCRRTHTLTTAVFTMASIYEEQKYQAPGTGSIWRIVETLTYTAESGPERKNATLTTCREREGGVFCVPASLYFSLKNT